MVAMALHAQGRIAEAEKRYEQILAIDPRAVVAANNLANIYLERGTNLDTALQLAQTAKSATLERPDLDLPQIDDTLGWAYYKKGHVAMAVAPLRKAADRDPKNAVYQFHAGMALYGFNDKKQAREKLELALKLDPRFAGADEARQTLEKLKQELK